jgi:hypothetical protein
MRSLAKWERRFRSRIPMTQLASVSAALLFLLGLSASAVELRAREHHEFNEPGNYLIADQFNNRVIEVEPDGEIVWQFGKGPKDFTEASIIGTNDAQRVGDFTLMAGTGIPAGQLEAPNCISPTGCLDNRVILVNRYGHIVWQYGQFGVSGSDPMLHLLNTPVQNTWLPGEDEHDRDKRDERWSELPRGHVLITDQGNERIIEVDLHKNIVWQYGTTGVIGNGPNQLSNPNSAELLENGHILIADENNNRAIEVDRDLNIIHTYTAGGTVSGVAFASRLENGHTLLTDSNNSRIVEVDGDDEVVWQYFTNTDPSSNNKRPGGGPLPTRAVRLKNGDTLISDQYNHRVIEVDKDKEIVRTFGKINMLGYNTDNVSGGGLNSPYDSKAIGDYTGLTPPFSEHRR